MAKWYKGKKRIAKKYYPKDYWKVMHEYGPPVVGGISGDCGAFNVRIKEIEFGLRGTCQTWGLRKRYFTKRRPNLVLRHYDVYGENGEVVCPCAGMGYQPPTRAEDIRRYLGEYPLEEAERWGMDRVVAVKTGAAEVSDEGMFVPISSSE
jgi:hypothetical protein